MKKGGLTAATVEAKLRELRGNMAAVGRHFGVTRQAVFDFCRTRPTLLSAANDVRESMKDDAENSLQTAIEKGEAWAVCFYLKTQAKDRGYVERQELSGADGEPMTVRFVENIIGQPTSKPASGPVPETDGIHPVG